MRARVSTTPEADAQVLQVAEWWEAHRPAAPWLFTDELLGALDLLARAPDVGRPYRHPRIPGLRRLFLAATKYHLYYVHDLELAAVVVLAVWSAKRGRLPTLRHT